MKITKKYLREITSAQRETAAWFYVHVSTSIGVILSRDIENRTDIAALTGKVRAIRCLYEAEPLNEPCFVKLCNLLGI